MGISAKQDFSRASMSFLSKGNVTHAFVIRVSFKIAKIGNVVEIFNILLFGKITQNINVTICSCVFRKNIVVRNQDNFFFVPNLRVTTKFFFKDANRARSTNIMGHQQVGIHPNIFARANVALARRFCQNLFGECHSHSCDVLS